MKPILKIVIASICAFTLQISPAFSADDIEALKTEVNQLKAKQSQTEVEVLKKELSELKIKILEEKITNAEKRLDDKISSSEKRLDDKISISEKQTDNKFESKIDNIGTKLQQSKFLNTLFINEKSNIEKSNQQPIQSIENKKSPRPFALHIGLASSKLKSTSGGMSLDLGGISIGLSYKKNRFFGELIGTSVSGKIEEYSYSYNYWSYNYLLQTTEASMKTVDFRLGYQLGGDIFKFEPYVGIGKGLFTVDGTSSSFNQFAPGAKLSLGSSAVRTYIDITIPSVISKDENYDNFGYKPSVIGKIGLSFAF